MESGNVIDVHDVPRWPCPGCSIPSLEIVSESFRTVIYRKTDGMNDQDYHPAIATGRFVCLLNEERCIRKADARDRMQPGSAGRADTTFFNPWNLVRRLGLTGDRRSTP
jgi:hypothetical protein